MGLRLLDVTIGDQRKKTEPKKPNKQTDVRGSVFPDGNPNQWQKRALRKSTRDELDDHTRNSRAAGWKVPRLAQPYLFIAESDQWIELRSSICGPEAGEGSYGG
jgi:hypothetical protein